MRVPDNPYEPPSAASANDSFIEFFSPEMKKLIYWWRFLIFSVLVGSSLFWGWMLMWLGSPDLFVFKTLQQLVSLNATQLIVLLASSLSFATSFMAISWRWQRQFSPGATEKTTQQLMRYRKEQDRCLLVAKSFRFHCVNGFLLLVGSVNLNITFWFVDKHPLFIMMAAVLLVRCAFFVPTRRRIFKQVMDRLKAPPDGFQGM